MLSMLLDEHISPVIAERLKERCPSITIVALASWEDGRHLSVADEDLLVAAHQQLLTLVTYDRQTIEPLLKFWAEHGHSHGGVIFIDHLTIRPDDFGGLVLALKGLYKKKGASEWVDRVVFLTRTSK